MQLSKLLGFVDRELGHVYAELTPALDRLDQSLLLLALAPLPLRRRRSLLRSEWLALLALQDAHR